MAAEAGQLQLNVMEPIIAFAMFTSIDYLTNAVETLVDKCIIGITANEEHMKNQVMNSIGIVTQLNPILGYEKCSEIAGEALRTGKSVHQIVVIEQKYIDQNKWDEIFSLENLIAPKFINK
jgi:aspartate ammonia-lyase